MPHGSYGPVFWVLDWLMGVCTVSMGVTCPQAYMSSIPILYLQILSSQLFLVRTEENNLPPETLLALNVRTSGKFAAGL